MKSVYRMNPYRINPYRMNPYRMNPYRMNSPENNPDDSLLSKAKSLLSNTYVQVVIALLIIVPIGYLVYTKFIKKTPVDCQVSDPENGECICKNGKSTGSMKITRRILVNPQYGGKQCPSLETTDSCDCPDTPPTTTTTTSPTTTTTPPSTTPPVTSPPETPSDCIYYEWQNVGDCSAYCGGGLQLQKRYGTTPHDDPTLCLDTSRSIPCNTETCPPKITPGPNNDDSTSTIPTGGPTVAPAVLLDTGSGTVTIPDNAQAVIVEMAGGGGGGSGASSYYGGGGGGSGTFAKYVIRANSLPKNVNYSIGLGGKKEKDGISTIFGTYVASGGYGSKNMIGGKGGDIYDKNQISYDGGDGGAQDGLSVTKEATNGKSGGNSGGSSYGCLEWGAGGAGGGGGGPGGGNGAVCGESPSPGILGGGGGGASIDTQGAMGGNGFIKLTFI